MAMVNLLLSFLCIFTTTALSQPTSAPPYSQEPIDAATRSLLLLLQSPQPHHWLQSHPRLLSSLPSSSSETPTAPTISSGHWHAPTSSPKATISTRTSPLGGSAMAESQSIILILKILEHGSIRGLSILSFELELVGYTIALAYCLHGGLPFSAYGELAFLLIQALILVAIMYYYSQPVSIKRWMTALLYPSLLRKRRIRFLFFLMWKLSEMSNLPLSLGP